MKARRLPDDLTTLKHIVQIEVDDEEDVTSDFSSGLWAIDSQGRIWKQDEGMTKIFDCFHTESIVAPDDMPHRKVK